MHTRSLPAHAEAVEELDPILQGLVALLREALTADQRAQFLALSERDLTALTAALSLELSRTPAPATQAEVVTRVLNAMAALC